MYIKSGSVCTWKRKQRIYRKSGSVCSAISVLLCYESKGMVNMKREKKHTLCHRQRTQNELTQTLAIEARGGRSGGNGLLRNVLYLSIIPFKVL